MAMTTDAQNQDYRAPRTMTTHTSDMSTKQLEFCQAMSDFRHMFPNMDEEVIESVLRSNSGAVDATIDQLLTMNIDNSATPCTVNLQDQPPQYVKETPKGTSSASTAPPPYSVKSSEPPPSYQEYAQAVEQSTQTRSINSTQPSKASYLLDVPIPVAEVLNENDLDEEDLLGAIGGNEETTPKLPLPYGNIALEDPTPIMEPPAPPVPSKMPLFTHDYTPSHSLSPKSLYKESWVVTRCGDLPTDFLRISISPPSECHHCHQQPRSSPSSLPSSSPNTTPVQRSKGRRSRSGSHNSSPRPGSIGSRSPRLSPRTSGSDELSSEFLQQKMAENERKRSLHSEIDPATLQMLEDERFALMLQNEEFLTELMSDEDFLRTLERDRMNATAFEPPAQQEGAELDTARPRSDILETEVMEGYGDDRHVTLGAFPFDRSVPEIKEKDRKAEFRRQLANMGGSSKKKLVTAAKKFFSRKKKSSKQLLKENSAPSTANLLAEDEMLDVPSPNDDSSSGSRASYGDWYTY